MSAEARPAPRSAPRPSLGRVSTLRDACASPSPFSAPSRALEIGDLVRLEGSDLVGVLRYLGEVHSRPGMFAGIELIGECAGRGKNDGTVDGVQYFATTPQNGVFGPAAKVVRIDAGARSSSVLGRAPRTASRLADASDATSPLRTPRASRPRTSGVPHAMPASASRVETARARITPRHSIGAMRPPARGMLQAHDLNVDAGAGAPAGLSKSQNRSPSPLKAGRLSALDTSSLQGDNALHAAARRAGTSADIFAGAPTHEDRSPSAQKRAMLLEQMQLSSRRASVLGLAPLPDTPAERPRTTPSSDEPEFVAISEYEQQRAELDSVRAELAETRLHSPTRGAWERERAEMRALLHERERELEEAKRLEVGDEVRRRCEVEERERALRAELESLHEQERGAARQREEHARTASALEAEVQRAMARVTELEAALATATPAESVQELKQLQDKFEQVAAEWASEREELKRHIDELKGAGRETISMFEQQLALADKEQQELRDRVQELEGRGAGASAGEHSTGAAEIDNASLREQLAHQSDKALALENELAEVRAALEQRQADAAQGAASRADSEDQLRAELTALRDSLARRTEAEERANAQARELTEALEQSQAALERERAELETLRADAMRRGERDGDESEMSRLRGEVERLVAELGERDAATSGERLTALQAQVDALTRERQEQDAHFRKEIAELESLVETRIFREDELETEMESLRKARDSAQEELARLREASGA